MTLPINHLIRTLDRCCGDYEILAHTDSTREPFEATVEHLQTGNVYRCSKRKDHNWTASDAHSEFLINRLNGLARDDSGTMRTDAGEWEVIENPPPEFVIQEGDEWTYLDKTNWVPCTVSIGKTVGIGFVDINIKIRRRRKPAPLPADFDCVPEVSDEPLKEGDWVVCVDAGCSGINVGDVLQVKDFDSCNDPGFDLPRGRSFYLTHRFRRARPDEIPQPVNINACDNPSGPCACGAWHNESDKPCDGDSFTPGKPVEQAQPLQLREGAWYQLRKGLVVGPLSPNAHGTYKWIDPKTGMNWTDAGKWWRNGQESDNDIEREVPAPSEPTAEPDADGWIEHDGRDCPVEIGKQVQVKRYDYSDVDTIKIDSCSHNTASDWHWMPATLGKFHITHYRLVQPAPKQYRPFASAAEFSPHRDRWLRYKHNESGTAGRASWTTASGIEIGKHSFGWTTLFHDYVFDDNGQPCGVEVSE